MELKSFKELLLKKSAGNKVLSQIVSDLREENLVSHVLEVLEKMAVGRPTEGTGTSANPAITGYASRLSPTDVEQIRDAMGHHVSHYRAALQAMHKLPEGSPERQKLRSVADQHLNHLIPMMHLVAKLGAHSDGKIGLNYEKKLGAWETNYTTVKRNPNGRYKLDPKLLRVRPTPGARAWSENNQEGRGIPDYRYLEMPPHPGSDDHVSIPHTGGYPWEDVRIGSNEELNNGEGHLHIEDVPDKKEYEPHPFDKHPIHGVKDIETNNLSEERLKQFVNDAKAWPTSEHHENWLKRGEEAYEKDPEGYEKRGKTKPGHVYEGIPLHPQPGHIHLYPKQEKRLGGGEARAEAPAAAAATPAGSVMVRKKGATEATPAPAINVSALPAHLRHLAPGAKPSEAGATQATAPPAAKPAAPQFSDADMEAWHKTYHSFPEGHAVRNSMDANPQFKAYREKKGVK